MIWGFVGCDKEKILMTFGNIQRHWILRYTTFKGDLFLGHHDVTIFCLAQLLKLSSSSRLL